MKKFKKLIEAVNDKSRVRGYTHRFYTYPAGFSPTFVESAIKTFTKKKELVFDPFMGGGTSLIEAVRLNRKVVGIDLNPIATFVAKVKLTKLSKSKFLLIIYMNQAILLQLILIQTLIENTSKEVEQTSRKKCRVQVCITMYLLLI